MKNLIGLFLILQCTFSVNAQQQKWALIDFVKVDSINPILSPDIKQSFSCPVSNKTVNWEERNVLNPSAIVKDNKVYLIYRAQDNQMTSRLGLAISEDGLHFKNFTSTYGVDLIWHNRVSNRFLLWGPKMELISALHALKRQIKRFAIKYEQHITAVILMDQTLSSVRLREEEDEYAEQPNQKKIKI